MSEKRIKVWVQAFKDRKHPMLQWLDPETGRRKSQPAETADPELAEQKRADLESDLNNGRYKEASRMSWERFRELFEAEYVAALRPNTRRNYGAALDLFERLTHPGQIRTITERTASGFAASMRTVEVPGRGKGMQPSSIKQALRLVRTALLWAVEQGLLPKYPKFPAVKVPKAEGDAQPALREPRGIEGLSPQQPPLLPDRANPYQDPAQRAKETPGQPDSITGFVNKKKPQPVPAESFERLLGKAPDQMTRAYLLTGWLAGLRLSEAFELRWDDNTDYPYLDLGRNRIILPAEFVKADEDQWLPLDPALREVLEALPRRNEKVFNFLTRSKRPMSAKTLSKRITTLARAARVRLSMHTLRKGFGCRYAGKVPAQVLQRLMRHADIKTTMDYYANVDAAVEAAVLGERCNSSRNTPWEGAGSNRPEGCGLGEEG
jgi:integrase